MFVTSNLVVLLLAIFLSSPESETATTAISTRPLNRAVEGQDFTLEWTYTLHGRVGSGEFLNVSGSGTETIGKVFGPGNITTEPKYQARFRGQIRNNGAELTILAVQRSDETVYRISVLPTGSGSLKDNVAVKVQYQPSITFISGNQTVNDGNVVLLNCSFDGFPPPSKTWIRLSTNRNVTMPLIITGKQDEGVYRCSVSNQIGNPATSDVFIAVQSYRPFNTSFSTNLTSAASLNETFYLMCSAEANPAAQYRLYKENESVANITAGSQGIGLFATSVSDKVKQLVYRCIPFNSFGDGPTKNITVTVHYPAKASSNGANYSIAEGEVKNLLCPVDGNPKPNIEWYSGSEARGTPVSTKEVLTVKDVRESVCYTCLASNSPGTSVSISQCLIVYRNQTTVSSTTGSQQSTSAPFTAKPTTSERKGTSAPFTAKPTTSERKGSPGPPWIIIIAVGGGVVLLAILVGVLTWWVHKQRKCRKDTKSKDQTLLESRRSHESRQQSCMCWPTYKRVISNV